MSGFDQEKLSEQLISAACNDISRFWDMEYLAEIQVASDEVLFKYYGDGRLRNVMTETIFKAAMDLFAMRHRWSWFRATADDKWESNKCEAVRKRCRRARKPSTPPDAEKQALRCYISKSAASYCACCPVRQRFERASRLLSCGDAICSRCAQVDATAQRCSIDAAVTKCTDCSTLSRTIELPYHGPPPAQPTAGAPSITTDAPDPSLGPARAESYEQHCQEHSAEGTQIIRPVPIAASSSALTQIHPQASTSSYLALPVPQRQAPPFLPLSFDALYAAGAPSSQPAETENVGDDSLYDSGEFSSGMSQSIAGGASSGNTYEALSVGGFYVNGP